MPIMPPPPGAQAPPGEPGMPGAPAENQGAGAAGVPSRRPATSEGDVDQAQVEQFTEKSFQVIYGGDTADGELSKPIASMLRKQANDPAQALADTAAQVAAKVITSAMDNNVSLDPAAAFAGLMEIVGELASIASAEGIYDYGQEEVNAAAVRAGEALHGLTREMGFFSQEEAMQDAGAIAEASQSGELDQAIGVLEQGGGAPPGQPAAPGGPPIMGRQ